jgi:hypothetical protein
MSGWLSGQQPRGVDPGQQPRPGVAHVPFHADDLPGKEEIGPVAILQRRLEQAGALM